MRRGKVRVAEVARPHGIRGELRLKVDPDGSGVLFGRPLVRLVLPDGTERDACVTSARPVNKAVLVRLAGVDDRDAAEALRGAAVYVDRDALPATDEGEFYACDVEGAKAVLRTGEEVGIVRSLASYPTCDALVIERPDGARLEVPLVEGYVDEVDAENQIVRLATIEDLA